MDPALNMYQFRYVISIWRLMSSGLCECVLSKVDRALRPYVGFPLYTSFLPKFFRGIEGWASKKLRP